MAKKKRRGTSFEDWATKKGISIAYDKYGKPLLSEYLMNQYLKEVYDLVPSDGKWINVDTGDVVPPEEANEMFTASSKVTGAAISAATAAVQAYLAGGNVVEAAGMGAAGYGANIGAQTLVQNTGGSLLAQNVAGAGAGGILSAAYEGYKTGNISKGTQFGIVGGMVGSIFGPAGTVAGSTIGNFVGKWAEGDKKPRVDIVGKYNSDKGSGGISFENGKFQPLRANDVDVYVERPRPSGKGTMMVKVELNGGQRRKELTRLNQANTLKAARLNNKYVGDPASWDTKKRFEYDKLVKEHSEVVPKTEEEYQAKYQEYLRENQTSGTGDNLYNDTTLKYSDWRAQYDQRKGEHLKFKVTDMEEGLDYLNMLSGKGGADNPLSQEYRDKLNRGSDTSINANEGDMIKEQNMYREMDAFYNPSTRKRYSSKDPMSMARKGVFDTSLITSDDTPTSFEERAKDGFMRSDKPIGMQEMVRRRRRIQGSYSGRDGFTGGGGAEMGEGSLTARTNSISGFDAGGYADNDSEMGGYGGGESDGI